MAEFNGRGARPSNSANSMLEKEEYPSCGPCGSPVQLFAIHGGNLSVVPSQETPQIHAISSVSPRLRGEFPFTHSGSLISLTVCRTGQLARRGSL